VTFNPVPMAATETVLEVCPAEVNDCIWLKELAALRAENTLLRSQVIRDPLTGLHNYQYFEDTLNAEMQRTQRTSRPTCLLIIDLDHFKRVNDERGHEAGNEALKTAANVFRSELRQLDIVCRYGGEEFTVILPQTSLPVAVNVAERLRIALENSPVNFKDQEFRVTASFGVAIYQSGTDMDAKMFVDQADQFMYQAKQQGRNQVCHADFASLKPRTEVSSEEKSALFSDNEPVDSAS
jgi:two-component system cell cycle response regulator